MKPENRFVCRGPFHLRNVLGASASTDPIHFLEERCISFILQSPTLLLLVRCLLTNVAITMQSSASVTSLLMLASFASHDAVLVQSKSVTFHFWPFQFHTRLAKTLMLRYFLILSERRMDRRIRVRCAEEEKSNLVQGSIEQGQTANGAGMSLSKGKTGDPTPCVRYVYGEKRESRSRSRSQRYGVEVELLMCF